MSDNRTLQVLLIKTLEEPKLVEIRDELKEMQNLVGGYIQEIMPFDDDVALICNEEGKLTDRPLNRAVRDEEGEIMDIIAGDFFLCRAPVMSEKFESLTKEQIEKYQETFKHPESFIIRDDGIGVRRARKDQIKMER